MGHTSSLGSAFPISKVGVIIRTYLPGLLWGLASFCLKKSFWLGKGSRRPSIIIGGVVPSLPCSHLCVPSLGDTHTQTHTHAHARMHSLFLTHSCSLSLFPLLPLGIIFVFVILETLALMLKASYPWLLFGSFQQRWHNRDCRGTFLVVPMPVGPMDI